MVAETVTIKKLTLADAEELLALSKKTFFYFFAHLNKADDMEAYSTIAFTLQKIQSELNNPNSHFFFAILNDEVIGYLKLNYGPAQTEFQDINAVEIERIYVLAEHHSKKAGHQFIDFTIKEAAIKKLQYIWLGVWEHNQKALAFYKKHGFEVFSSHEFILGSDKQTVC
ncbi:GNAT family N-acetyltransferase [Mucilaginibacter sp. SMC90]|uniref:GNAT family N-acetyltransferase n=1 Tax=Mucilaginibacter sp. SMC90 TaxID=2929803 RepID=UPI001FB21322|nr:GNAT family N-acetyltransferase [Mucilaginibacter sp. SMC90]UOE52095.1 GNAT family N-acetyltransferase [Mucilaginibacter sp. SMC90]